MGPKEVKGRPADLVGSVSQRRRVSVQRGCYGKMKRDVTAQVEAGINVFAASPTLKLQRA